MQVSSNCDVLNNPLYGDLLRKQSQVIQETRFQVEQIVSELEEKRSLCTARKIMLNIFKKDVMESFADCRTQIKKSITAMMNHLNQQQEEMLRELDDVVQHNMGVISQQAAHVDCAMVRLGQQLEEGQSLLREQDTFLFFSKGNLYKLLPSMPVPTLSCQFKDTFPDLMILSIQPFQVPLQHAVQVDMRDFLQSPNKSLICGNIFHNGFRFQIQLKHNDQHLSVYLCLRAWHDISAFLCVTVSFMLAIQDGPELLHSATAKNTFSGCYDGWGWNKFTPMNKLWGRRDVLFQVHFNELMYTFVNDNPLNQSVDMESSGDHLGPEIGNHYLSMT